MTETCMSEKIDVGKTNDRFSQEFVPSNTQKIKNTDPSVMFKR